MLKLKSNIQLIGIPEDKKEEMRRNHYIQNIRKCPRVEGMNLHLEITH